MATNNYIKVMVLIGADENEGPAEQIESAEEQKPEPVFFFFDDTNQDEVKIALDRARFVARRNGGLGDVRCSVYRATGMVPFPEVGTNPRKEYSPKEKRS
jgi:hypothetical protein